MGDPSEPPTKKARQLRMNAASGPAGVVQLYCHEARGSFTLYEYAKSFKHFGLFFRCTDFSASHLNYTVFMKILEQCNAFFGCECFVAKCLCTSKVILNLRSISSG